jgi:hypothetical protein
VNTYFRPQQPPALMSIRTDPPTASIKLIAASLTWNGGNKVSSAMKVCIAGRTDSPGREDGLAAIDERSPSATSSPPPPPRRLPPASSPWTAAVVKPTSQSVEAAKITYGTAAYGLLAGR